jgi:hypothetical protein
VLILRTMKQPIRIDHTQYLHDTFGYWIFLYLIILLSSKVVKNLIVLFNDRLVDKTLSYCSREEGLDGDFYQEAADAVHSVVLVESSDHLEQLLRCLEGGDAWRREVVEFHWILYV